MPEQPEKLDLASADVVSGQKAKLRELFPEVVTEGGKVDFDRLKLTLGETVDTGKERYGMNWPGKADCFKTIQQPSVATLVPARTESVDFDATENLIIEGDNLEVLKLLQKSYLGKVKMIYIDPPYNTGNDFIYPDNYTESLDTYLRYTGQADNEGRKYSANVETDGRFHSKWLNMMYPRLYIARNLLSDDGIICISIDDCEVQNLHRVMDEIFGEENFYACFAWQKKDTPSNDVKGISVTHEYVLAYVRSEEFVRNLIPRTEDQLANYKNPDNDPRGAWIRTALTRKVYVERDYYAIKNPQGRDIYPPKGTSWRVSRQTLKRLIEENRIWWGKDADGDMPFAKRFLSEVQQGVVPTTWWDYEFAGSNRNSKMEMRALFEDPPFDTPKPVKLISRLLAMSTNDTDIVLDFFAGSGTTGQAVLELNDSDGGERKFVLVQLPEPTNSKEFSTIADITKERVRRVIKKLVAKNEGKLALEGGNRPDLGFKVFKLTASNFRPWNADVRKETTELSKQLEMHVRHIVDGRTQEDLLFEILLKSGFPLSTPTEKLTLEGKTVFSVAGGAMFICLETMLTPEVIKAMADRKPERVVCLDEGFAGNDQLKTNAVQTMRARGVTSFKTI